MAYRIAEKAARLEPYDPDGGTYRVHLEANESFLLPTEQDREKMAEAAASVALNRYPDPSAADLCAAFAGLYHLDTSMVTAGNGSDELISVLLSALMQKGETVMTAAPDFSMYRFYASLAEVNSVTFQKPDSFELDVEELLATIRRENVRMFIFSNPCNPTGLGLTREQARRLITGTEALIVLDEAYMDFWDQSMLSEVAQYDNLIILRTCSKALGLAALRVGFAVANPTLTKLLHAAKSPYNVNSVTQAMAAIVLQNPTYYSVYTDILIESRNQLYAGMKKLEADGLITKAYETHTNFVYVTMPDAKQIHEDFKDRGILVRRFGDTALRITAGTQAENQEVLACLRFLLKARQKNA